MITINHYSNTNKQNKINQDFHHNGKMRNKSFNYNPLISLNTQSASQIQNNQSNLAVINSQPHSSPQRKNSLSLKILNLYGTFDKDMNETMLSTLWPVFIYGKKLYKIYS